MKLIFLTTLVFSIVACQPRKPVEARDQGDSPLINQTEIERQIDEINRLKQEEIDRLKNPSSPQGQGGSKDDPVVPSEKKNDILKPQNPGNSERLGEKEKDKEDKEDDRSGIEAPPEDKEEDKKEEEKEKIGQFDINIKRADKVIGNLKFSWDGKSNEIDMDDTVAIQE